MAAQASFVEALINANKDHFRRATQSPFLAAAAAGTLSRTTLSSWLANDRLYIHNYIQGLGRVLSFLELPHKLDLVKSTGADDPAEERYLSWLGEALSNILIEEKLFGHWALNYHLDLQLPLEPNGRVVRSAKLSGLRQFEHLFNQLAPREGAQLPWLETAVVFYLTERCYLEAWTWAKGQARPNKAGTESGKGGDSEIDILVKRELMENWTNDKFVAFVQKLGEVIDDAVRGEIEMKEELDMDHFLRRIEATRDAVLHAEEGFWPAMPAA